MTASPDISTAMIPIDADGGPARTEIIAAANMAAGTGFDYSGLDAGVSALAKRTAEKARKHWRQMIAEVIDIGADLIRVKDRLEHGLFIKWLEAEVGWSDRTARSYMSVADAFEGKSETVSDLPLTTLYKLASRSTPAPVRKEIVRRLESGQTMPVAEIEETIAEARARAKQDEVEAQLTPKQRRARARSAAQRKREREEREADGQRRREHGKAVADKLIAEFGVAKIRRILDAMSDSAVYSALREAVREPQREPLL